MTARLTLLALALSALTLHAQDKPADKPPTPPPAPERHVAFPFDPKITDCGKQPTRTQATDCTQAHYQIRTITLTNVTQQNDANEILVAVRNMFDPAIKVFLLAGQNALVLGSYPEELDRMEALIHELDHPHKTYRLTFTVADSDGGKRIGVQHFSIIAADGQRSTLKQGSKIPIATGKYDDGKNGVEQQFTYLDIGMNIDVTPTHTANGVTLKAKVEQSGIASETTIAGIQEPVIRQSVLDGVSILTLGKPVALGQIDIPGSTRHLDLEVVVDLLP